MASKKKSSDPHQVNEPMADYGQQNLDFNKIWLLFQETDAKFKETDAKFKETDKKLNKAIGLFTTQWGKLMEALIAPSCLKLFRERGIDISRTYTNVKVEQGHLQGEFDIVLANGSEVVIVEVKTTLTPAYVDDFLEKLNRIREYLPEHKEKNIYGAVAGIKYENSSDRYAYKNGLFVLVNKGEEIIKIANNKVFSPRKF